MALPQAAATWKALAAIARDAACVMNRHRRHLPTVLIRATDNRATTGVVLVLLLNRNISVTALIALAKATISTLSKQARFPILRRFNMYNGV